MKKTIIVGLIGIAAIAMTSELTSNPTGAPLGRTGSPADGATCSSSGCHFGTPSPLANVITSNIPASGYVPGQTYTITVTVPGSGNKGFQVSPQKTDGTQLGTLQAGPGTQVNGKYITHTSQRTGTAIWTFNWVAPAAGTGNVTFYGAFAQSRQVTRTSTLSVSEAVSTSVSEMRAFSKVNVYPNPASSEINLAFNLTRNSLTEVRLLDLNGKEISVLHNQTLESGNQTLRLNLPGGLNGGHYFVTLKAEGQMKTLPIFVKAQ